MLLTTKLRLTVSDEWRIHCQIIYDCFIRILSRCLKSANNKQFVLIAILLGRIIINFVDFEFHSYHSRRSDVECTLEHCRHGVYKIYMYKPRCRLIDGSTK